MRGFPSHISHLTVSQSVGRHVGVLSFFNGVLWKWEHILHLEGMCLERASLVMVFFCLQKALPFCGAASLCWAQPLQWTREVLIDFPECRATRRSRRDGLCCSKGKQNWIHILLLLESVHAQHRGPVLTVFLLGSGLRPHCWGPLISRALSRLCFRGVSRPQPSS